MGGLLRFRDGCRPLSHETFAQRQATGLRLESAVYLSDVDS